MAQSFISMKNIAREMLPLLQQQLVMPELCYKDYSDDFIQKGSTIQVERPVEFTADEFSTNISIQELQEQPIFVKMDKIADVSFTVTQKELSLSVDQFRTKYLESAAVAIAEKINRDGLDMYKYLPYEYGASGTTPDALEDFAQSNKILNDNKAPINPRNGVWDTASTAAFQVLDSLVEVDKAGTNEALRMGGIGKVFGINNFMSQAVKTHTAGLYSALADVTITAATTDNAVDPVTGFNYTSAELTSAAVSSTDTLLKGDLLSYADDDGTVYQAVVLEDTSAAVSGVVTAKLYPALSADATATDVTFADVTAGGHVANMVFHPKAFAFVTRPMAAPPGVESYVTNFNGIALRVTMDYNITTKKTTMSIDTLYDFAPLYPELGVRVLG
jgi:hypothetical protein